MKKITIFFSFLLLFTFFFVGSTYASYDGMPPVPVVEEKYTHYIHITNPSASTTYHYIYILASNNSLDGIKAFVAGSNTVRFEFISNPTNYKLYKYSSADTWSDKTWVLQEVKDKSSTDYSAVIYDGTIVEVSTNIYKSKDSEEIFFHLTPIPTTPTVEEMIAEEVPIMAEKVTQTMKIILLCGVGCLALLIGLPLFGKVFRMFHVK